MKLFWHYIEMSAILKFKQKSYAFEYRYLSRRKHFHKLVFAKITFFRRYLRVYNTLTFTGKNSIFFVILSYNL